MTEKTVKSELEASRAQEEVRQDLLAAEIREDRDVWRTSAGDRSFRPSMRPEYWR